MFEIHIQNLYYPIIKHKSNIQKIWLNTGEYMYQLMYLIPSLIHTAVFVTATSTVMYIGFSF